MTLTKKHRQQKPCDPFGNLKIIKSDQAEIGETHLQTQPSRKGKHFACTSVAPEGKLLVSSYYQIIRGPTHSKLTKITNKSMKNCSADGPCPAKNRSRFAPNLGHFFRKTAPDLEQIWSGFSQDRVHPRLVFSQLGCQKVRKMKSGESQDEFGGNPIFSKIDPKRTDGGPPPNTKIFLKLMYN